MSAKNIKSVCEHTKEKLEGVISKVELFLNANTLKGLSGEDERMENHYKGFLSDMRHLLVFAEVQREKLGLVLRKPEFNDSHAERVLYHVYHQCVNTFFYPTHEFYTEDGRYAYTGQDAIRFREKPNDTVKDLILGLSPIFEGLREELTYYESDFVTKVRLMGEKI